MKKPDLRRGVRMWAVVGADGLEIFRTRIEARRVARYASLYGGDCRVIPVIVREDKRRKA